MAATNCVKKKIRFFQVYANCMGVQQISEVLPLLNSISQGGGVTGGGKSNRAITAKAFSYPHTEFGALRSRRLVGKFATN